MIRRLPEFHAATARIDNRAVFEVPEVMADLMGWSPMVGSRPRAGTDAPTLLAA
jgi:hypothetical protein